MATSISFGEAVQGEAFETMDLTRRDNESLAAMQQTRPQVDQQQTFLGGVDETLTSGYVPPPATSLLTATHGQQSGGNLLTQVVLHNPSASMILDPQGLASNIGGNVDVAAPSSSMRLSAVALQAGIPSSSVVSSQQFSSSVLATSPMTQQMEVVTLQIQEDDMLAPHSQQAPVTCAFFKRTGTCAYGDRCKFLHPVDCPPPHLNSRGYPLRPQEPDCPHYLKKGWCAFGATCKFHHSEEMMATKECTSGTSTSTASSHLALAPHYHVPLATTNIDMSTGTGFLSSSGLSGGSVLQHHQGGGSGIPASSYAMPYPGNVLQGSQLQQQAVAGGTNAGMMTRAGAASSGMSSTMPLYSSSNQYNFPLHQLQQSTAITGSSNNTTSIGPRTMYYIPSTGDVISGEQLLQQSNHQDVLRRLGSEVSRHHTITLTMQQAVQAGAGGTRAGGGAGAINNYPSRQQQQQQQQQVMPAPPTYHLMQPAPSVGAADYIYHQHNRISSVTQQNMGGSRGGRGGRGGIGNPDSMVSFTPHPHPNNNTASSTYDMSPFSANSSYSSATNPGGAAGGQQQQPAALLLTSASATAGGAVQQQQEPQGCVSNIISSATVHRHHMMAPGQQQQQQGVSVASSGNTSSGAGAAYSSSAIVSGTTNNNSVVGGGGMSYHSMFSSVHPSQQRHHQQQQQQQHFPPPSSAVPHNVLLDSGHISGNPSSLLFGGMGMSMQQQQQMMMMMSSTGGITDAAYQQYYQNDSQPMMNDSSGTSGTLESLQQQYVFASNTNTTGVATSSSVVTAAGRSGVGGAAAFSTVATPGQMSSNAASTGMTAMQQQHQQQHQLQHQQQHLMTAGQYLPATNMAEEGSLLGGRNSYSMIPRQSPGSGEHSISSRNSPAVVDFSAVASRSSIIGGGGGGSALMMANTTNAGNPDNQGLPDNGLLAGVVSTGGMNNIIVTAASAVAAGVPGSQGSSAVPPSSGQHATTATATATATAATVGIHIGAGGPSSSNNSTSSSLLAEQAHYNSGSGIGSSVAVSSQLVSAMQQLRMRENSGPTTAGGGGGRRAGSGSGVSGGGTLPPSAAFHQ
ncbi:hypothetical protein CEUSTIGMA_g12101.t1 [Chlamydomonas eustigma]|uniref:C3H1-type domain-containing protein n=1 Tax=Chlamydomonas eustigma TaxID=1157962 RepID=A0A250XPF0_9CHLO|nr:hypothetical protein CEUSTIGMA_g12101.t1 [Chlamydomonas eustigma]|eukprot:GAX84680.1 hypothetical protein CEUSTIGMA_g12101.t1 [Chlamydomonas eustigma]